MHKKGNIDEAYEHARIACKLESNNVQLRKEYDIISRKYH